VENYPACVSKLLDNHSSGLHDFVSHVRLQIGLLILWKVYEHFWNCDFHSCSEQSCRLSGQHCGEIFWVKFEDLAENISTAVNVVYNCIRIQPRGLGVRDHIVNFVARLKGRKSGFRVVTAVSCSRFCVTHAPLTTGVLSNSLFVSASSSWLPAGSIILPTQILEKSRHPKWVILGFSSYCLNWQCFNQCVFVYVCVFALRWPSW